MVTQSPPTTEIRRSNPGLTSCGKAGDFLPSVSSLEYRTLTKCMYWFLFPSNYPSQHNRHGTRYDMQQ